MRLASLLIVLGVVASLIGAGFVSAQVGPSDDSPKPVSMTTKNLLFTGAPSAKAAIELVGKFILNNPEIQLAALKDVSEEAAKEPVAKIMKVLAEPSPILGAPEGVIYFHVESYDKRVPANKLSDALIKGALHWLGENDVEHQFDQRNAELLQHRLSLDVNELEKQEITLRTLLKLHKVGPSPELNQQRQQRLEMEVASSEVLLAGLRVRQRQLEEKIAEIGKQASSGDDAVVEELTKAVKIREQLLAVMAENVKAGTAMQNQLLDAKRQVVEANAELAKARRDSVQAVGGQRLADLRRRFDDTSIEIVENDARKKVLEQQFLDAGTFSSQCELQSMKVDLLKESYRARAQQLNELRAKLQLYQSPHATVLQSSHSGDTDAK
jgi:hypothetical protein